MSSIFDRMLNGSTGMKAARMMEALGMPSNLAELAGAQMDSAKGDLAGVQRLMAAASQGLSTAQADNLFGKGLPPQGFVPRPAAFLSNAMGLNLPDLGRGFNPFGGAGGPSPFGGGLLGGSLEQAISANPLFKGALERQLGGMLAGMSPDGGLSIYRPPFNQLGAVMRQALGDGLMPQTGLAATFANMALPLGGRLGASSLVGSVMTNMQRLEGNMTAFMGRMNGDNVSQAKGELMMDRNTSSMAQGMGIDIRNASFEDILFLMLMKYAKKKEDDIMAKVKQLDASSKAAENKKAAGGTSAADPSGNTASTAGGAGMEGTDLGGTMDPANMSETMKQQAMQKLMGDLSKLYEMLSNMIKSMHDMQMTPVRALRG
jgi:hypothetical protein